MRIAQRIANTSSFASIGARLLSKPLAACQQYEFDSDDYWECFILQHATSVYHQVGTCKMGAADDKTAVVDPTLRLVFFFLNCMFYQLLHGQHSCSSTRSWGSVLPSIVETRDQNSRGCPLLFSNRNLGSFCT